MYFKTYLWAGGGGGGVGREVHNYKAVHVYKDLSLKYCVPLGISFDLSGSHLPLP